jgi:GMP synthase-like glutamine amidotransferase
MWGAMSTCVVVQHVAPESAFAIEEALTAAGIEVDLRRVFAGDPVPEDARDLDGLVVMGGPMSAASDDGFPSRRAELALLAHAMATHVPTLGVCLGAQLVAAAAGAAVYPGAHGPEIGWSPVDLSDDCRTDPLFAGLPGPLTVLQWHGDTFDLPGGARHLARNAVYPNQAFRVGDVAWGVQFHLEVTAAAVDGFLTAFASDLGGLPGGAAAVRADTAGALAALAAPRTRIFARFAALVAAPAVAPVAVAPVAGRDLVREA